MKYQACIEEHLTVEADSVEAAQEAAFALHLVRLSPSKIRVWGTDQDESWSEDKGRGLLD